jgi:hypothetical protein
MSALELLDLLAARDIRLAADGDKLTFDGPANAMDTATMAMMKRHKAELLKVLSGAEYPAPSRDTLPKSTLRPNRLRWADVPHSNPPRPLDTPTDPARVQLAEEIGAILTAFPKGNCKLFKSGDWMIHGNRYSHDQAVQLVATVTARHNGQEVPPPMVPDFDAGAAYRANLELVDSMAINDTQSTLIS